MPRNGEPAAQEEQSSFSVKLENFEGPFDLLLQLISRRELDVIEISLAAVTDEFLQTIAELEESGRIGRVSEFLVVAATLLDMKVASLLPKGEVVDPEDVAAFEARDLLFARLLQYRAFKEISSYFGARLASESKRHARYAPIPASFLAAERELIWTTTAQDLAALAVVALAPRPEAIVQLGHLHAPAISIREQAAIVVGRLRDHRSLSFGELIADVAGTGEIVARFISILELYRDAAVGFEQIEPLGVLVVRWVADEWDDSLLASLGEEYDA